MFVGSRAAAGRRERGLPALPYGRYGPRCGTSRSIGAAFEEEQKDPRGDGQVFGGRRGGGFRDIEGEPPRASVCGFGEPSGGRAFPRRSSIFEEAGALGRKEPFAGC